MKEGWRNPVNLHHSTCNGLFNGGESVTENVLLTKNLMNKLQNLYGIGLGTSP